MAGDESGDFLSPLRILREERGMNQKCLASRLGLARNHLIRLESRAIDRLTIAELDRICQGLDYKLEEVIQRFYTKIKRSIVERSKLDTPAYVIHYNEGVRMCVLVGSEKPYLSGVLRIQPYSEWGKESVITKKEIFIHVRQGNLLLKINGKEHLFKEDEHLTLSMPLSYEIYNPHQFKELVAMIYVTAYVVENPGGLKIAR
ncbi:MAG: helix-turn-helix transcriptional regulator [Candidatus Omnitrophota bacterium]